MTPEQIRQAVSQSPELLALARRTGADGQPQPDTEAIAAALSAGRVRYGVVTTPSLQVWVAATGMRAKIEDHATNPASGLRSIALTLRDLLQGGANGGIHMDDPANRAMLDAWVNAGELTDAARQDLLRRAELPDPVAEFAVRQALLADDGTLTV